MFLYILLFHFINLLIQNAPEKKYFNSLYYSGQSYKTHMIVAIRNTVTGR